MPVLVNGVNYAWGNISLILFGVPVIGITKISYKTDQVKDNNYGHGQHPISRGYGNFEPDGSIELYLDEWKRIIAASPDRDPLKIPMFDIPVVMAGPGIVPTRDVLRAVEFKSNPMDANQGDTKLLVTIPLIIGKIDR
jgi:hypothetical protein